MCYNFYPTSHFSPFLFLPSTGRWAIFVHWYLFISTYCLLRCSNAQHTYSCTVCLLMHSMLTYAQPFCTVYKDVMDTHFNRQFFLASFLMLSNCSKKNTSLTNLHSWTHQTEPLIFWLHQWFWVWPVYSVIATVSKNIPFTKKYNVSYHRSVPYCFAL